MRSCVACRAAITVHYERQPVRRPTMAGWAAWAREEVARRVPRRGGKERAA